MPFVEKYPNPGYELFFAPLQIALPARGLEKVGFAYQCSKHGHQGQVRDGGERYFNHPKRATWIYIDELGGRDVRTIIDILLHDLSEDARLLSPFRIAVNFGAEVAADVRALTKVTRGKKEPTDEYLARVIAQGPRAILAKLCDRLDNLRTLEECPVKKQRSQVAETEKFHIPLLIPALKAHGKPWADYAEKLAEKMSTAIAATRARLKKKK